jgi:hypothetical protein
MTEQPDAAGRPEDAERPHASVSPDVARAESGRTDREAAVDEAMGSGDDPAE